MSTNRYNEQFGEDIIAAARKVAAERAREPVSTGKLTRALAQLQAIMDGARERLAD